MCIISTFIDRASIFLSKYISSNHIENTLFEDAIMQVPVMKMLTTCIVQYQQNYSDISVMIAEFTVMLAIASLNSESSATTAFNMLT